MLDGREELQTCEADSGLCESNLQFQILDLVVEV